VINKLKESERKLAAIYESQLAQKVPQIVAKATQSAATNGIDGLIAVENVQNFGSVETLRKTATDIRARLGNDKPTVVAIAGVSDKETPMVLVATNEAARAKGVNAGNLVRSAARILGGNGGGKPDFAQGGGSDASKVDEALAALTREVEGLLK
jgi:alanyl-tRNA synthetase